MVLPEMLALFGALLLVLGLFGGTVERTVQLGEPVVALLFGVVVGPAVLGWLRPEQWTVDGLDLLQHAARVTLAVSLFGIALRIPDEFVRTHWKPTALLIVVAMPLCWLVTAGLAQVVLGGSFLTALLVAAVVTPTDPVVSASIVVGDDAERRIPAPLRHLLLLESGANDGLAYLLLALSLHFLDEEGSFADFLLKDVVLGVLVAVVLGVACGLAVGKLTRWSHRARTGNRPTPALLGVGLALMLMVLGLVDAVGSDGVVGAFAAALAFNWIVREEAEARHQHVHEAITRFFDLPVFVLLGTLLPWEEWGRLGWSAVALIVLVLLLRRLPVVLGLSRGIRALRHLPEASFFGWFGPIGVAAVLWSLVAREETDDPQVWPLASLLVCASVLAHGISANGLSRLLAWRIRQREASSDPSSRAR